MFAYRCGLRILSFILYSQLENSTKINTHVIHYTKCKPTDTRALLRVVLQKHGPPVP